MNSSTRLLFASLLCVLPLACSREASPSAGGAAQGQTQPPLDLQASLSLNASDYWLTMHINGQHLKAASGGSTDLLQLFHENHPRRTGAGEDVEALLAGGQFCLREGLNRITIRYERNDPEGTFDLRGALRKPGFNDPLLSFEAGDAQGEWEAQFDLPRNPASPPKTVVLGR